METYSNSRCESPGEDFRSYSCDLRANSALHSFACAYQLSGFKNSAPVLDRSETECESLLALCLCGVYHSLSQPIQCWDKCDYQDRGGVEGHFRAGGRM